MKRSEIQRKCRIASLNLQIAGLRLLMHLETGVSDRWKAMARCQCRLIQERNSLMTPAEIRKIEKSRGLV